MDPAMAKSPTAGDARPVRPTEQLDWPHLQAYLREQLAGRDIPGLDLSHALEIEQFPGGHSNLTYLIRFGEVELVLRRPPLGPVAPTAHDMAREFRWLAAVHPVFPRAPQPYVLCEDASIIGSTFYVMERRRGVVIRYDEPAGVADPDVRRRISEAVVDTLAELHAVDVSRNGLNTLGKPAGFVERQVRGWSERWQRSKTTDVPEMDALTAWLRDQLPGDPARPTIVHGDFKLDNLMLDADDLGRIVAVFDWEMSALGDPLVDLGILLAYWSPTAPPGQRDTLTPVTGGTGWFSRDEIVERYGARSGRDLSRLRYYEVFALFKIAVVIQQIYFRYVRGQTDDPRFAHFGDRVLHLARQAAALAGR
jgi:aminoglycoside phosphotransferase (APT) family kinase protein